MTSQVQTKPELAGQAPGGTRTTTPVHPRLAALGLLLLLLLLGAASAWTLRPPQPRPASAPATDFSAARATALLGGIASVPHPAGSAAAADVRAYLVDQLRGLGLEPEVQTRVAARAPAAGRPVVATVSNVHARIAGSQPTGRVLLVAHYDSVPTGPGASDNGANVAAILEVVRALRAGGQPRNDVDVLLTDAEEAGLLGAQAFVDSGAAGDPRRVVAINLEARGVSGPAVMFQMAGTGLAPAVRAADPVTTSFAGAVYQVLPNDTDLTVFGAAGMRGLNFAFMEGAAHYHTPHDDIANVSGASVQDMGESALGAIRYLAGSDLSAGGSDATYFSLFGTVVSYPGWLTLPLAGLTLVSYVLMLWAGRRRGLRMRGVGRGAATFALVVPAAAVVGLGGWWLLTLLRPSLGLTLAGVYRAEPYALPEAAVLLVALIAWYRWARRTASAEEVVAGVLGWLVLFALAFAVLLPGGAYLFAWPALVGVAALAATLRFSTPGSPVRALAGAAAAVPGMALVLPIVLLLLPALGLGLSVAPLLVGALFVATMAGLVEPLPRRRVLSAGMVVVLVAALATAGISSAVDGYDARRPQPVSLAYALEADTGAATWLSAGGPGQPQVGALLTAGAVRLDERIPPLAGRPVSSGPAPVATGLDGARAQTPTTDESGGVRTVRVRLEVPADMYLLDVYADTSGHEILDATANGAALAGGRNVTAGTGPWRWGFRYTAPRDGVDLTLRARGSGPVRIRVVSTRPGLPTGVGAPVLRPDVSWTSWPLMPAQTIVVRTLEL
jgi:hypothetical protein